MSILELLSIVLSALVLLGVLPTLFFLLLMDYIVKPKEVRFHKKVLPESK